jgi:hypothetical protein
MKMSPSPACSHLPGSHPQPCNVCRRAICRCLCGASVALQSGSTEAAEHMRRARAAWRMLHRSSTAAPVNDEPRVIWLPKLVKQTPAQAQQHRWIGVAKARQTPTEAAAAARHSVAAGAAAVRRAEAVALAAAQRAASLAASAGVGYQVPQALLALGAKPADEEAQTVKHVRVGVCMRAVQAGAASMRSPRLECLCGLAPHLPANSHRPHPPPPPAGRTHRAGATGGGGQGCTGGQAASGLCCTQARCLRACGRASAAAAASHQPAGQAGAPIPAGQDRAGQRRSAGRGS